MGFFDWLFGKRPPVVAPRAPAPGQAATGPVSLAGNGSFEQEIVGEAFYQDALDAICGGKCEDGHDKRVLVLLQPEPTNKHDRNAVVVKINGTTVGYLSRDDASDYHEEMTRFAGNGSAVCRGRINGGWHRTRRTGAVDEGNYGVELDIEWPFRSG